MYLSAGDARHPSGLAGHMHHGVLLLPLYIIIVLMMMMIHKCVWPSEECVSNVRETKVSTKKRRRRDTMTETD
jgi:hypothetical protein